MTFGRHLRMPVAGLCLALAACAHTGSPGEPSSHTKADKSAAPAGFSKAVRRAMPSVVGVYGIGGRPDGLDGPAALPESATGGRGTERAPWSTPDAPANIGAGFFINDAGLLVTAAHVVADAGRVLVKTADSRIWEAEVLDQDDATDIALLRVSIGTSPVPAFGTSAASRPGDWVLAVGEPFGLQRSVVAGIVAGRMRHFAEDGEGAYIQSDLALNPGNSGGPLLNSAGEVIGMNLRTVVGPYGTAGVSLSMPIEMVLQITAELQGVGARPRPRLGAGFEDVSPPAALAAGRAYATGAFVNRVDEGGTAQRLGLQVGDIVVGFDGRPVEDSAELARWLSLWRGLPRTRVVVWRDRRYLQLKIP